MRAIPATRRHYTRMKKCTYCGKEYPDEATSCSIDGQPLKDLSPPSLTPPQAESQHSQRASHGSRKRISHISIHQTSKVMAILFVVIGLLFIPIGVIFILAGQTVMGIVYVLMPFIYGIIGYPYMAVMCWVYNIIAKSVGGIEFTLEDEDRVT